MKSIYKIVQGMEHSIDFNGSFVNSFHTMTSAPINNQIFLE